MSPTLKHGGRLRQAYGAYLATRPLTVIEYTLFGAHMTVHTLMRDSLLNREKEAARYALMLDPLTAAVCSPAEISTMFDEMWKAQLPYLQYFER